MFVEYKNKNKNFQINNNRIESASFFRICTHDNVPTFLRCLTKLTPEKLFQFRFHKGSNHINSTEKFIPVLMNLKKVTKVRTQSCLNIITSNLN